MWYVYLLRSQENPRKTYVGRTANLRQRLVEHNAGKSRHTGRFAPWRLVGYVAFSDKRRAHDFELYLKTGSGRAFAKRHLS